MPAGAEVTVPVPDLAIVSVYLVVEGFTPVHRHDPSSVSAVADGGDSVVCCVDVPDGFVEFA
jgi:hypothetical protein